MFLNIFNLIEIYKKLDSNCERNCKSFSHIKDYGNYSPRHKQMPIKNSLNLEDLNCKTELNSPCLSFHKLDIENILYLLDKRLKLVSHEGNAPSSCG